jgi:hypothetical protein
VSHDATLTVRHSAFDASLRYPTRSGSCSISAGRTAVSSRAGLIRESPACEDDRSVEWRDDQVSLDEVERILI